MNITIRERHAYGHVLYYPVCETATRLTLLTGAQTLTVEKLRLISQLGYNIDTEKTKKPWETREKAFP